MPGYTISAELASDAVGSTWAAVGSAAEGSPDGQVVVLKILTLRDGAAMTDTLARAASLAHRLERVGTDHLVRQYDAIALADGRLALVLDQVSGSSLTHLLDDRGPLTPGETVTTLAPLFGALADLHEAGVVHGDLTPRSVQFTDDGRPLIGDLGVAQVSGRAAGEGGPTPGFVAPEVVDGAAPSASSDVYSLGALGWFCLTGAAPSAALTRPSMGASNLRAGDRLFGVLASCLSADPTARPAARAAAIEIFDAAPAESVVLTAMADPASEITRRIRATAASAPIPEPTSVGRHLRRPLAIGVVALLLAAAIGGGASWALGLSRVADHPVRVRPSAHPTSSTETARQAPEPTNTARSNAGPSGPSATTSPSATTGVRSRTLTVADVMTARNSPRAAPAQLLQALVDARALAYAARNPVLLDLVYAPGATKAAADRQNIGTAVDNGATYLGLAFVVKGAAFLDGTSDTARIRATIVTPAYETGQPDGRKVPQALETVGPSVFTLSLTRDGWRILGLTAP